MYVAKSFAVDGLIHERHKQVNCRGMEIYILLLIPVVKVLDSSRAEPEALQQGH
jgi:hypothetical protein